MSMKNQIARSPVMGTVCIALLCLLGCAPCLAITAKDVTEKMSKEERFGYLTGLIDMQALQAA